jgi:hypothetical protein
MPFYIFSMSSIAGLLLLLEELESRSTPADEILRHIKDICTDVHALETMSVANGLKRARSMSVFDKDFVHLVESPASETSPVPLFMP